MPCVLESETHEEINKWLDSNSGSFCSPAPLFIQFECGFVPLGVFPAMIACLTKEWREPKKGIKKNRVQFLYGGYDTVTLISQPKFYAVHIERDRDSNTPTHEVCSAVQREVEATLKTVTSRMNSSFSAEITFSFDCPSHSGREHFCSVDPLKESMYCPKDEEGIKMKPQHLAWHNEVSNTPFGEMIIEMCEVFVIQWNT